MASNNNRLTPRQKMINLMYIVLTAMLALNVSSDVLNGFLDFISSSDIPPSELAGLLLFLNKIEYFFQAAIHYLSLIHIYYFVIICFDGFRKCVHHFELYYHVVILHLTMSLI